MAPIRLEYSTPLRKPRRSISPSTVETLVATAIAFFLLAAVGWFFVCLFILIQGMQISFI